MFSPFRAALAVSGVVGLVAAPSVIVMLALLVIGASSGLIVGLGFLAMTLTAIVALSKRGQSGLKAMLRKASGQR
ncbi:hypothetical protein [Blastomonas sp.]|uniref:hypothetical protein n=1 Tax=Blastomonas sp. TaxID=1909299 RepID=UPI0035938940